MSAAPLEQAIRAARAVLDEVTAGDLSLPTPCASWTVAELINHMIGAQYFFSSAMNGSAPSGEGPDVASGDHLAAFDAATAETLAAFGADGAMDRVVHVPFGDVPAPGFAGFAATDTFTHAWDLAKALGRKTDLAPELAAGLLAAARTTVPDTFRGPDGQAPFGPEQPAPAGSTNADQLAAFLGRSI